MIPAIFIWLVLACVVAYLAEERGRSALGWLFAALIISPLLAVVLLMVLPRRSRQGDDYDESAAAFAMSRLRLQREAQERIYSAKAKAPVRLARGDRELGEFGVDSIAKRLGSGDLHWDDLFWDEISGQWQPLTAHPGLALEVA